MTVSAIEAGLLSAVGEDPTDPATLLVLADYLDEQGREEARWARLAGRLLALEPLPVAEEEPARYPEYHHSGYPVFYDVPQPPALDRELVELFRRPDGLRLGTLVGVVLAARTPLPDRGDTRTTWTEWCRDVESALLLHAALDVGYEELNDILLEQRWPDSRELPSQTRYAIAGVRKQMTAWMFATEEDQEPKLAAMHLADAARSWARAAALGRAGPRRQADAWQLGFVRAAHNSLCSR
jgi:uncharacterized protein (TIGR02996 family)